MFAMKTTLRSVGLGAVLVACALSAQATTVHFVVDAAGTANDFWGDITVNSLSNPLFGAGSSLPTGMSVHSSGLNLSFTPTSTQTGIDRWDFNNNWFYVQVKAPSAIYTSGVTSWQDLITHGSYSFALAQYGLPGTSQTAENGTVTYSSPSATPVPAPLPILGVLAAFGWSRKLRRRIKHLGQASDKPKAVCH